GVDRLEQVLNASTSSNDSDREINALYTLILVDAFDDPNTSDREKDEMRLVLHTAICAREPLNARVMAAILGLKKYELVHAALNPLRSVLDIQKANEGITTLHKSFPDYMFDRARSRRFYCNAEKHNAMLAGRCWAIIKIPSPPFNICHLESSYLFDKNVADLHEKVERYISGGLFYACRYWGAHLELAGGSRTPLDELRSFLSERLLLWMEVLNLKGCLQPTGINLLIQVKEFLKRQKCTTEIRELAKDAHEFVDAFLSSPASQSTPHIYLSALASWEKGRPVSEHYSNIIRVQTLIRPMGQAVPTPRRALLPIYSLGSSVRCVAFSPDGAHVAAGSDDAAIRVWNLLTGQIVGVPLRGHTGPVCSVVYSPDGANIAASSTDGTIRTWDARAGHANNRGLFEGHTGPVCSVVYLDPDGDLLVSGSADRTIRFWRAGDGQICGPPREGHTGVIYSVARSLDNKRLVSGSSDGTIRTWVRSTGQTTGLFQGHGGAIHSVAYSPDNAHIISGSEDMTIRIWNAGTGEAIGIPLQGHTAAVYSVAYTPNGARIISGSADSMIRIWDASSGTTVVGPLVGHRGPVHSVACSPDGSVVASGSADNTICIWDAKTGQMMGEPLKWHTQTFHSITYATENTPSPPFADNDILCSWDAYSGRLQLNPSLQKAIYNAIVVPNPLAPNRAGTYHIQDQLIIPASHGPPPQASRKDLLNHTDDAANHHHHSGRSSPTPGDSMHSGWILDHEGWVTTNSSQRLFCVPKQVRDRIWYPQATRSISTRNALWLDPSTLLVGGEWCRCYIAPEERGKGDPIAGGKREQEEASGDPGYPPGSPGSPGSPGTPGKDNNATEGTHSAGWGI
ncbi:hypothetical protein FRC10_005266, partial [Ceratobasidium sp. 414]